MYSLVSNRRGVGIVGGLENAQKINGWGFGIMGGGWKKPQKLMAKGGWKTSIFLSFAFPMETYAMPSQISLKSLNLS